MSCVKKAGRLEHGDRAVVGSKWVLLTFDGKVVSNNTSPE